MRIHKALLGSLALAFWLATGPAPAQETLKLTVGQRGNWDTAVSEIGQRAGIFKKHGLTLELLYTQGSAETQQAVISGSVDIGVATGTMGALGAYGKGAPIRIIGAETTGAGDIIWYVKADSPVRSMRDVADKTVSYSNHGSSTHSALLALLKQYDIRAKPVSTGGTSTTLTQVMSGQIDVGWTAPPSGFDALDKGQIRMIGHGNEADVFRGQTIRVLITHRQTLETRKDAITRYMRAYRETLDYMYSDPAALKHYAEFVGVSEALAKRIRDEFFPKGVALNPDRISGLDIIIPDAVALKYIPAPLTSEQIADLVRIPPRD
jgi:NitT/TauT family transport system substrate-binding protein